MSRSNTPRTMILAILASLITACGGGGDAVAPPASMTVSASPTALSVQQGSLGTVTLNLTRTNFTSAVSVSVDGLPSGVTVFTAPSLFAAGITSATVNIAVASTVAAGTYTAAVHASASGVTDVSTTFAVTVVEPPNFSLVASPATATASSATPSINTITIARTGGYAGSVSFALQSARAGLTGVFTPSAVVGNSSTLVISATADVPVGTYPVTITGTGVGVGDRTTTIAVTIVAPPDFSVAVSPPTATISSASPSTHTITITRTGGYTGSVLLALQSPQAGITGTFTPASGTGGSSSLVISATSAVPVGTYPLTIAGTGVGFGDRATPIAVTILAPPDYSLAVTPNALSIAAGASGNSSIAIARTGGFTGAVTLALTSAQAGITGVFASSPTTSNSSALTVSVAASVPSGVYTATVTGTATGTSAHTTALSITVPAPVVTTATFCDNLGLVVSFVAVQDGTTGAWTRTNDGATHTFTLTQNKGGVATIFYSASSDILRVDTFFGTAEEIQAQGVESCAGRPFKTISGTASGVSSGEFLILALGRSTSQLGFGGPFTMPSVQQGAVDLIARRFTISNNALNRILIRRELNIADGGTITPMVDMSDNSAEAIAPLTRTLSVGGLNGATSVVYNMNYRTVGGTTLVLHAGAFLVNAVQYPTVPSNKQVAGDLHIVNVNPPPALISGGSNRGASLAFFASADKSITLGPDPATPTITTLTTQTPVRLRVAIPIQSEYSKQVEVSLSQDQLAGSSVRRSYRAVYAAGYIGAITTLNVDVPDFVALGLPGLRTASPVTIGTIVTGWSGAGNLTFDGALTLHAERALTFTP